jgi:tetratricopeptide (TPR) repeat protein
VAEIRRLVALVVEQYDLFISYRRKDSERVRPLVDALTSRGLAVWFDQSEIGEFAPITDKIRHGLANSKALLTWYSIDYSKSRPCQMELTAAFIAAQREGDPRQRVWVINPEATGDHIQPVELRDEQYAQVPKSNAECALLSDHIVKKLSGIKTHLGAVIPLILPQQYGRKLAASRDFVGRLPDIWKLHSALHGAQSAIITGESPTGLAQVSGMGGVGKSLLAEEYALRFSAAYPGGIFWLRALGNDANRPALTPDQEEAVRSDEFRNLAIQLRIDVSGLDSKQTEAAIAAKLSTNHPNSFLWIVDDVASGLTSEAVRAWLAPHPLGKTLFTTRSREYQAIGNSIRLDVLEPNEAYELLCRYRKPTGPEEEGAAHGIAADLGYHPLALAVCSRALEAKGGMQTFSQIREALGKQSRDELELAAEFAGVLPSGHEPSVAATLLRGVRSVGAEGLDFLLMASLLAAAPIPSSLVASVFSMVDGLDEADASHRAALAFSLTENASLSEQFDKNARTVHALVSRAIKFSERNIGRRDTLKVGIIEGLNKILPDVEDIRAHERLSLEVLHAREICNRNTDNLGLTLTLWVARHDFERGAYTSARELQEKVLKISKRVLGEEHPDTLMTMHNLANTLSAQGDLSGALGLREKVVEISKRSLGEEDRRTLASMNNLSQTLSAQGDLEGARRIQEKVLEIIRRIQGEEHPDTLMSMDNLAVTLSAQGDLSGARRIQEKVLEIRRRIQGEEHPNTLMTMNNLANALSAQGDLEGARALEEKVLEIRRRIQGEEHPDTLMSMHNLASTLRAQGDLKGARLLQEKVLQTRGDSLGEEHPSTLMTMNNLANTLSAQGDLKGARKLEEKVLETRKRILGEEHPDTLMSMNNLAETLRAQGDLKGARELHEKVVEISKRSLGEEDPRTLTSMNNLANTLSAQGDVGGAQPLQEEALEIRRRIHGEEHPDTLMSMNNLAETLRAQGDLNGARELQQKVLNISRRVLGEEHPNSLTSMNNLAAALSAQRDQSGARELQEKVLTISGRVLGEEHPDTLRFMNNLAETLRVQGDLTGARELQEKVIDIRKRFQGEEHPDTLKSMGNLALTLGAQGDLNGARQLEEKVLEMKRRVLGEEHPDTSIAEWNLLVTLWKLGEQSAVMALCEKLVWLLEPAPESLGAVQRQIRNNLEQFLKTKYERGP